VRHNDVIKPEYFSNPVVASMGKMLVDSLPKYSRNPSLIEMEEEITLFLDKNEKQS